VFASYKIALFRMNNTLEYVTHIQMKQL